MFHFYIKDGLLNLLRYFIKNGEFHVDEYIKTKEVNISDLIDDKRFFPEASSWEFCMLIESRKGIINFASYNHNTTELKEGLYYPLEWKI